MCPLNINYITFSSTTIFTNRSFIPSPNFVGRAPSVVSSRSDRWISMWEGIGCRGCTLRCWGWCRDSWILLQFGSRCCLCRSLPDVFLRVCSKAHDILHPCDMLEILYCVCKALFRWYHSGISRVGYEEERRSRCSHQQMQAHGIFCCLQYVPLK